jgi:hypothetical protein
LSVRRFVLIPAVVLLLLVSALPVAADTGPGGPNFNLFASSCTTTGGRQVCTDTNLGSFANENGSIGPACVDLFTYSISSTGRFSFVSEEFGCADSADGVVITDDLSVAIAPTSIALEKCGRRTCTASRTVTVAAKADPSSSIGETTSRSTTTFEGCTYRTTTTDRFADLAGGITVDDITMDATGFVDDFTSTTTVHCH